MNNIDFINDDNSLVQVTGGFLPIIVAGVYVAGFIAGYYYAKSSW